MPTVEIKLVLTPDEWSRWEDIPDILLDVQQKLSLLEVLSYHSQIHHEEQMAVSQEVRAFSQRIDTATSNIAARLKAFQDKIEAGTPLTEDDKAELNRLTVVLENMGKNPENPVEEPPTGGTPTTPTDPAPPVEEPI